MLLIVTKSINRIKEFIKEDLFKASFLNGIANIVRILTGIVSNKVIAVFLGPSGIALLGQFQNFCTMVLSLANFGINSGVTKYIAEYNQDVLYRKKLISTGFYIVLAGSLISALIVFFFRSYFSESILNTKNYLSVFGLFAITLVLFVLNAFFISILNGYKEFTKIVIINIFSSVFGLVIAIFMVIYYGVYGAFIGYILSQTLIFFVTLIWVFHSDWFKTGILLGFFDKKMINQLGQYTLMTFVSVFAVTFIQLKIRTYIMNNLSLNEAGYWQGIMKICELYITFITTTLGIYYLPRLSELRSNQELRNEILFDIKIIIPVVVLTSILIYFLRDFIINILFSADFKPMRELFFFQLLGNILKISSWLLAYLMIAKAMVKTFIISELAFGLINYGLTVLLLNKYGIIGVTYAYSLNYFLYLIVMVIIFKDIVFIKIKRPIST
jgi:polysaccharide transporter, PST family